MEPGMTSKVKERDVPQPKQKGGYREGQEESKMGWGRACAERGRTQETGRNAKL